MAKTTKKRKKAAKSAELDSTYLLKLILYVIIGSQWLRLTTGGNGQIPIPIGLFIGVFFASHDHFQIDRKIEYAVLLMAMLVGFWSQVGIFVNL
ncbi:MAG: hypothetical protein JWO41_624 [Candidatus Saccharibacteria bacterium]|nr:hypothetical protein [Candidatus Saccharibacteria bacterium]